MILNYIRILKEKSTLTLLYKRRELKKRQKDRFLALLEMTRSRIRPSTGSGRPGMGRVLAPCKDVTKTPVGLRMGV
jgi:hypothetical protein